MVGVWGTVGFSNYFEPRTWLDAEVTMLRTAAEMFAAFWERRQARTRLEEMIRSKDEFVAAVSHELRTPLTHGRWTLPRVALPARRLHDRGHVNDFVDLIADQSADSGQPGGGPARLQPGRTPARSSSRRHPVDLEAEIRTLCWTSTAVSVVDWRSR